MYNYEKCFEKYFLRKATAIESDTSKAVITNVIFNPPATIVFWSDNTKTVVKSGEHDIYDPEKGLAMAIAKKLYGNNKGSYYNVFRKYIPRDEEVHTEDIIRELCTNLSNFGKNLQLSIYD